MTDTITLPLNRLALWAGNVRKTGVTDGIAELAASIAAHGLLQSLVVRKGKRGKFEIVAGQRRFLALQSLANDGTIAKDFPVPCLMAADDIDAAELSLAENVIRAPMHPADQFEAYRTLIDDGASLADVAARFGISEITVAKRLKLGRLSSVVLDAYRNGEIDLDEAQAFAISDDHAEQERVLGSLSSWNRQAHTIRRALTEDDIATSDKRVRFVNLDAYREAGGHVRQDLFCEDGSGYVTDAALLDRLVTAKLDSMAAEVRTEGWRWVDTAVETDYQTLSTFSRRHPDQADLSDVDQAELDRLSEEYDNLVDTDDADDGHITALEAQIAALNCRAETWSAETLAIAGALVTIGYDGNPRIERGLVRKEDSRAAKVDASGASVDSDPTELPAAHSAALVEDLTAQRTGAIAAELAVNPDVALAATVHALALGAIYPGYRSSTCLDLSAKTSRVRLAATKPDDCRGLVALDTARTRLGDHLPGDAEDLWDWCLARTRDELLDVLAYVAATSVNVIQSKSDRRDAPRLVHGDALALALKLDMTAYFTPTAESYFARVSKTQILAAIDEAKGSHAPALDKLKKTELAIRAEQLIAGSNWLPEPLRGTSSDSASANEAD